MALLCLCSFIKRERERERACKMVAKKGRRDSSDSSPSVEVGEIDTSSPFHLLRMLLVSSVVKLPFPLKSSLSFENPVPNPLR